MDYPLHDTDSNPNVTITILPVSLSLVHVPRSRLKEFSHPIIHQILRPAPTFLNISCNDTEVSIVAEKETVAEFVKAARRDWKKQQKRNSKERSGDGDGVASRAFPVVEVSSTWSALQIDSHGEQIDDASARIREISALLKGISILYQSSYATDFIFVQSARLPKVISILTSAKYLRHPRSSSFSLPRESSSRADSPSSSSSSDSDESSESSVDFIPRAPHADAASDAHPRSRGRRSRRNTTATTSSRTADSIHASLGSLPPKSLPALLEPEQPLLGLVHPPLLLPERPYSFSPGHRPKVTVLQSDLVVVGLSGDECPDAWTTRLMRLLLFSEDVARAAKSSSRSASRSWEHDNDREQQNADADSDSDSFHSITSSSCRPCTQDPSTSQPFFSLTRTSPTPESGSCSSSLTTDIHLLAVLFPPSERRWLFCGDEFDRLELGGGEDWEDLQEHRDRDSSGSRSRSRPRSSGEKGFLRCLHVDLQDFELDRHGLVNRFSAILHEAGIHHLYSSTFKTANLLVSERDANRALEVLRNCAS